MKVKIKKIHEDAVLPKKGTNLSACYDVSATEIIHESKHRVICKLGLTITPPAGYKTELMPRSSLTKYKWIMSNSPGQIDEDYQGELMVVFNAIPTNVELKSDQYIQPDHDGNIPMCDVNFELTYDSFPYNIGDRVAQLSLTKVEQFEWDDVDELPELNSDRGVGGFGSTGK